MSKLALELIAKEKQEKTGILDLGQCGLTELPEELFHLVWLEELYVSAAYWDYSQKKWIHSLNDGSENFISKISKEIQQLPKLHTLTIFGYYDNWDIKNISALERLTNLQTLDIRSNQISDISYLEKLTNLQTLHLGSNQISDISYLEKLRNLQALRLGLNQVSDISYLEKLTNLQTLDLRSNQISDISYLEKLTNLQTLDLSDNQISNITSLLPLIRLGKMKVELGYSSDGKLNLHNNPITTPPLEIVEQGNQAIIDYFDALAAKGKDYLFEAKVLVLGESGAGKTTFSKKIQKDTAKLPKDGDTTKGIEVANWSFELSKDQITTCLKEEVKDTIVLNRIHQKGFRANLWDFGGQEIYHGTHQFFLTHKSLYILLADTRKQDTDFNYWLNVIEQLSGNSPLIVILNERHGHRFKIDEPGLKGRFGKFYKETYEVNFADKNHQRLQKLRQGIKHYLANLSHIGDILPASWVAIRKDLADLLDQKKLRYIPQSRFIEICKKHGIDELSKMLNLSGYFHTIGVFIHYQNDKVLKNTIFLDANWTTKTVYQLLNDNNVKKNNGRFRKRDAKRIWKTDENLMLIDELLQLLERFSIAYHIENTENYIVPEHLPDKQPYEKWHYEKDLLLFSYAFDQFMPKGLMSRLIVGLHDYIEDDTLIWLRGLNITRDNTFAEITETYGTENRFDIKIYGQYKKELLTTIINAFYDILKPFNNLKYEQRVPCNCSICIKIENIEDKNFFSYQELRDRIAKGKRTVECKNDNYNEVQIIPMLEDVGLRKMGMIGDFLEDVIVDNRRNNDRIEGGSIYTFNAPVYGMVGENKENTQQTHTADSDNINDNKPEKPAPAPIKKSLSEAPEPIKKWYESHWIKSIGKALFITIPMAIVSSILQKEGVIPFEYTLELSAIAFCFAALFFISRNPKYKFYNGGMLCVGLIGVVNLLPFIDSKSTVSQPLEDGGTLDWVFQLGIQESWYISVGLFIVALFLFWKQKV